MKASKLNELLDEMLDAAKSAERRFDKICEKQKLTTREEELLELYKQEAEINRYYIEKLNEIIDVTKE